MDKRRQVIAIVGALALTGGARVAAAQEFVDRDGIRYQVIQQQIPTQIPVTEVREQQQTTYRQQVVTENVQHQQVYHVPVTQYQVVSRLHNRWNPFAEPYWTHHYEPVTTWQQQVGTVQIPVTKVTMVPETRTVQQPITTMKTVNNTVTTHRAIGPTPGGPGSNTALAAAPGAGTATASLTPVNSPPSQTATRVAANPYGGQQITSDPPRYGNAATGVTSGWSQPSIAAPQTQTATQPSPPPAQSQSRY
jgi:hypothetical protein